VGGIDAAAKLVRQRAREAEIFFSSPPSDASGPDFGDRARV